VKKLRSPGISALLSALFSGLGQIYNGSVLRGIILMVLYFESLNFLISTLVDSPVRLIPFTDIFQPRYFPYKMLPSLVIEVFLVWAYGIYDAYAMARRRLEEEGMEPSPREGVLRYILLAIVIGGIIISLFLIIRSF
jgi:TM2 domain-containing membrane protein YozV